MQARNVLVIMADEHSRKVLGAYGNRIVKTPNLDRLAAEGTLFENAYCNSPICVPSRASFATGRYVHEIGAWDNAAPYCGAYPSWGHRLAENGIESASIGKLHYRSSEDSNGFAEEIIPLHVRDGLGDAKGLIRNPPLLRKATRELAATAGPGGSSYQSYDRRIRDAAVDWLEQRRTGVKPWSLFVSFVCPHFPLVAPQEFFELYPVEEMPLPVDRDADSRGRHPVLEALRKVQNFEDYFENEAHVKRAVAAYYGLVSFIDGCIGAVLDKLREVGLEEDTVVIYCSDHGDNLGAHNLWAKSTMYEDSVGVPLIMRVPGNQKGRRVKTPVSLVDLYPTILAAAGASPNPADEELPGRSLFDIAEDDPSRTVMSEYHAIASVTGTFMVRFGRYKYLHYEGYDPQLYDLEADSDELHDLAPDPAYGAVLREGWDRLRAICDPTEVNRQAFADQQRRIALFGGIEAIKQAKSFGFTPAPVRD